ncbi:MAG: AMP-binding protein [Steroidobacteraceae bacterium]
MNLEHGSDPLRQWLAMFDSCRERGFAIQDSGTVTYGEMAALSGRYLRAMQSCGLVAGDRVALQCEKCLEAIAVYLACLRGGFVLVPLNPGYTAAETEYFLLDAEPSLHVISPGTIATAAQTVTTVTLAGDGGGSLAAMAASEPTPGKDCLSLDADTLAALVYTSGTTGRAKGAMLTRGNLASNADALCREWRFEPTDVLLHCLPIYHVHGLFISLNTVIAAGASIVFRSRFEVADVLRWLPESTVLMGVPTYYTRLLGDERCNNAATAHMRLFVSGSAPLLPQTHGEFAARTGHRIVERYGMSETLINTTNPVAGERRPGTVGKPLDGIELRLREPVDGIGVIEVRGPNVCHGYWRNAAKTAESFCDDGFFVTGDLGTFDDQGYLQIVGRARDLIISGGFNIYPSEVEAELDRLEGVLESAVVGTDDADLGEVVVAFIALGERVAPPVEAIRSKLSERLARYKIPRRFEFVKELPRNSMGKVQKAQLREQLKPGPVP